MEKSESPSVQNFIDSQTTPDAPTHDCAIKEFFITRLDSCRDQRTQPRREFDDMTYEQDYAMNQLAGHSYLRRKRNDDEVRVNTGTAEKKVELVLNELLTMNFQPEVRAFDEDDLELRDLGDDMADIVKRTNEIERDEDLYEDAFAELLIQRAVFIEEDYGPLPAVAVRTGRSGKFRIDKHVQKRLLSGLQVFLGDITLPAYRFQEQPWVIKYDRMLYEEAVKLYGELDEWKFVKPGMPMSNEFGLWFKYRFGVLQEREVEIITYMSAADDEYNVIINGVLMYKPGTKLPWRHGGYNMSMIVVKPVSRFFSYGKQPIASAKTLQALADETIRNLVRKFRQAIEPPLGVGSGKVYSKDIWSPGAVTQGLPEGTFTRLVTHQGVTISEFQMMELITKKIDEFVGPYGAAQTPGTGTPTATQIIEQQKQSMKMLGLAMLAAQRMKREMTYLRIWNVLEHYMEPVGFVEETIGGGLREKYRSFTIPGTNLGNGKFGTKVIKLRNDTPSSTELKSTFEAEKEAEDAGHSVRVHSINAGLIRDFPLTWYVTVSSKERDSSALDRVLFQDQVTQAINITKLTGRRVKADKLIESFESTWKAKGLFERDLPVDESIADNESGGVKDKAKGLLDGLTEMGGGTPTAQALPDVTKMAQAV